MCEFPNIHSDGKWRQDIYSQLSCRDIRDSGVVSDLIRQLNLQVERCENYRLENLQLAVQQHTHGGATGSSSIAETQADRLAASNIQQLEQKVYKLQEELTSLHRAKSDTAEHLLSVNTLLQDREKLLQEHKNKIADLQSELMLLNEDCEHKKEQIEQLTSLNTLVRDEYTTLNMTYEALHSQYLALKEDNAQLLQRWIEYKSKDAERLNEENDRHFQVKQRALEASIREAAEDFKAVLVQQEEGDGNDMAMGTLACPYSVVPTSCFFSLETHDADLHTLQLSHHGRLLATGGEDRKLKLWNVGREGLTACHTLLGSNAGINAIQFSPDDSLVIAASTDCASRIWSIPDLRIRHTLTGHSAKVMACKFVSDMTKVVTGGHDRTIKIWDLMSKACSRTIFVGSMCNDLDLSRSSPALVYSGHQDKTLRVYDLRTNKEAVSEIAVPHKVTSVSLFNNSYYCLVSCRDNVLRVVDIRLKDIVKELIAEGVQLGSDFTRACVSPDDSHVAVGSGDGSLHVWDAQTGAVASSLPRAHASCVMACSWTPDGQAFVSAERSKQVMMWSNIKGL